MSETRKNLSKKNKRLIKKMYSEIRTKKQKCVVCEDPLKSDAEGGRGGRILAVIHVQVVLSSMYHICWTY